MIFENQLDYTWEMICKSDIYKYLKYIAKKFAFVILSL